MGLIAAAENLGADALVVGGAGGGMAGPLSLGSVVNDLVHASPIPVVIAPRGARLQRSERIRGGHLRHRHPARSHPATQHRPAVLPGHRDALRLVSLVAVDDARRLEAAQQHAQRALDQAKDFLPDDVPVSSRVATGLTVEEAVNKLGWKDGDMIMVGSSRLAQPRRLFLGSTAAKMLRVLQVPMFVVPKDEGAEHV